MDSATLEYVDSQIFVTWQIGHSATNSFTDVFNFGQYKSFFILWLLELYQKLSTSFIPQVTGFNFFYPFRLARDARRSVEPAAAECQIIVPPTPVDSGDIDYQRLQKYSITTKLELFAGEHGAPNIA
ncbi:uncharacterized protein LOC133901056 [Phragmites australis]|uniref:uncharacterized protein LOC133901056 n=1 Tax=Phragmites australis TaxID=29695 RepID=UPI002D794123|nr:uncharacterized protein LOC133901056 [Phragmites australis]